MSETDSFQLSVIKIANGNNKNDASFRAKSISYSINQTDSLITFNNYFDIKTTDKLRAQEVKLILKY